MMVLLVYWKLLFKVSQAMNKISSDGFAGGLNDFKNRKRKLLTSTVDIEKLESGLNISKSGLEVSK